MTRDVSCRVSGRVSGARVTAQRIAHIDRHETRIAMQLSSMLAL